MPEDYLKFSGFYQTQTAMAGNWVDFENEIRRVIEFADMANLDLDEKASLLEGELIANMVSLIGEDKLLEKSNNSRLRFIKLDELDI